MWVYWVICAISVLGSYSSERIKIKTGEKYISNAKLSIVFTSLPLLLISAIRYGVGSDYFQYERLYSLIGTTSTSRYEPLFTAINRYLYKSGIPFQFFIILTSVMFVFLVVIAIYRNSPNVAFSIFLLFSMCFFFQSLNIVRQMVGCAICLYSIKYIQENKLIKFLICIAIACGFHFSAVIFLPVYFIYKIHIDLKKTIPFLVLFFIVQDRIVGLISNYARTNLNYDEYFRNLSSASESGYISLIINVFIYIFAYLTIDKEDENQRGYLNIQLITIALSMMNGQIPLLNRLRFYYAMPNIILVPMAVNGISDKNTKKLAAFVICVLFFAYCLFIEGYMNQSASFPYRTIFEKN